MGYERYPRGNDQRGYESRDDATDYGRRQDGDYYGGAAARDYGAGNGQGRRDETRGGYGGGTYGGDRDRDRWQGQDQRSGGNDDRSAYGAQGRDPYRQQRGTFERRPQDHGGDDRGFFDRAGDEVRSWFGDEDAERRREQDARHEKAAQGNYGRDEHYHSWRNQQIAAFDRDYDEYRRENQSRFHNEFSSWRTDRQGQRDLLGRVEEHATVVGSDGEHIGTVDKVRGDRIILTKNDPDAGGRHHSVPSNWLQSAEAGTVTLRKTAAEAKAHWRDEERSGAMLNENGDRGRSQSSGGATNLNRSFSGTY